jgi:hypothetical protein
VTGTTFFRGKDGSLSALWRFVFIVTIFLLIWPPIAAAALAAVLIEMVIVNPFFLRELADETMSSLELLLFASLIASLICWRLTRGFARTA